MTIFFIESYVQSVYVKEQYGKKSYLLAFKRIR